MKKIIFILVLALTTLASCKKETITPTNPVSTADSIEVTIVRTDFPYNWTHVYIAPESSGQWIQLYESIDNVNPNDTINFTVKKDAVVLMSFDGEPDGSGGFLPLEADVYYNGVFKFNLGCSCDYLDTTLVIK